MSHKLKLTIITPSYNQGEFIEATMLSIINQHYNNLEYIVIDGGSQDSTYSIIKKYHFYIDYWVSEPDRGQAHAINKGLGIASGDVVAFLNSDDLYLPGAFNAISDFFQQNISCAWVCGDTIMFGENQRTILQETIVPESAKQALTWQSRSPQPGMFWRRELLADGFDETLNYCFDHELYIRLLQAGHKCHHLNVPIAAYRLHPSSKTVAEQDKFEIEFDKIAERYEPMLNIRDRNLSKAIRYVRKSYKKAGEGDQSDAVKWLAKSLLVTPEITLHRPFWGSLKKIVLS